MSRLTDRVNSCDGMLVPAMYSFHNDGYTHAHERTIGFIVQVRLDKAELHKLDYLSARKILKANPEGRVKSTSKSIFSVSQTHMWLQTCQVCRDIPVHNVGYNETRKYRNTKQTFSRVPAYLCIICDKRRV